MSININTATTEDVQSLGINADWSKYIIDYREYLKSNGTNPRGFSNADDFTQMNLPAEYLDILKSNVTFDDVSETGGSADTVLGDSGTSADTADTQPDSTTPTSTTFLFVDVSPWEANPGWSSLISAPNFYGGILKATQGTKGWNNDGGWFKKNWPILKTIAGERYGSTWFRGAYLFLNFWQSGADQADNYLDIVDAAGGWDSGDMIPIVDVELGNPGTDGKHKRNQNQDASAQEIIDCTTECADRLRSRTGRNVMLYGRGAMRDKGIRDKMGCDVVWNPAYTSPMVRHGLEAWALDDIVLWQYCGDGDSVLDEKKFPKSIPGFGNTDISVYIEGANKPSFEKMKERLGIGTV